MAKLGFLHAMRLPVGQGTGQHRAPGHTQVSKGQGLGTSPGGCRTPGRRGERAAEQGPGTQNRPGRGWAS